jgi:undecaprenyl diphosphate synthase
MRLTFALSYGGRQDILAAVKSMVAEGVTPDSITEKTIEDRLQTAGMRDPDLIIRTSGESRLSNFFLWQSAYSELFITPTLWPDYTEAELDSAFLWYQSRERRFGRTTAQITLANTTDAGKSVSSGSARSPVGAT